jgi:peptidyl-prolyl cis-trans isomerase C
MRQFVRSGLVASIVVVLAAVAGSQEAPVTGQPKGSPAAKAPTPPPRPAILDQVLATVNGESVNRGELFQQLNSAGVPPGTANEQDVYRVGVDGLINFKLVNQFLAKQNITVTDKEVDEEYNALEQALKKDGQEIGIALATNGMTVAQVREEMKKKLRWRNYIRAVAKDDVLKKYVADNKDLFNRTQVRASHIVVRVEPTASPSEKETARQKLAAIKRDIDANKLTFADAANKFSEDDGNKASPSGGDLGYFTRKGQFEPLFTAAAFGLKKGTISDPVETVFGYHLIQVTDRKEGTPVDFEQNKLLIQGEYAIDLQERIVASMRKTAKIDIKPMPADLFPKAPTPPPGAPGSPGATGAPGTPSTPDAPKGAAPGPAPPR